MKRRKIVLIGAGSAIFTQGLVADLIHTPELGPYALGLVDIDEAALNVAAGLSRRLVSATSADIEVTAALDRREVLPGADVVLLTVGVGGRRAWEQDVFIPRKYGVYQPVGDTMMPGGISRAQRMIPALVAIAEDVLALCPSALFFNYSNPMTANCAAIRRATGADVIGLCHGSFQVERQIAHILGAPPDEFSSTALGLNHLTFFYDLRWNGRDVKDDLRQLVDRALALAERGGFPACGDTFPTEIRIENNPFSWSLFQTYGAYPAANDRHTVEFFPERFPRGNFFGKQLGVDAFSFEEVIEWGDNIYDEMRQQAEGTAPLRADLLDRNVGEHEQLLDILAAIEYDQRRIFYANLPNRGAAPNLPHDTILELPALAMAGRLRALPCSGFPEALAEILRRKLATVELTVEAALRGDRDLFIEALLSDGAVTDRHIAEDMAAELLEAQREYLPNFFRVAGDSFSKDD